MYRISYRGDITGTQEARVALQAKAAPVVQTHHDDPINRNSLAENNADEILGPDARDTHASTNQTRARCPDSPAQAALTPVNYWAGSTCLRWPG